MASPRIPKDVILTPEGGIDWNANGWPEPNPAFNSSEDGYSTDTMPDEVFREWYAACDILDIDWSADW